MADYWKSQPRKQCDFCKCWIADNKPSIDFHESGKKHKENVAKRLSEITKKSAKDAKHQLQVDKEIQKMEEAALRAYMKDIEGTGDFTSQLVLEGLEQKQKAADDAAAQQAEAKMAKEAAKQREKIDMELKKKRVKEKAEKTKWYEARSDEGYSYYWHADTNETKWDIPADGYITIADQKVLEEAGKAPPERGGFKKKDKNKPSGNHKRKHDGPGTSSAIKKRVHETKSSEAVKKTVPQKPSAPSAPSAIMGPAPKPNPYGLWKSIETKVEEPVDLELPSQERFHISVPTISDERPKIKFHEKKISRPIEDGESSSSQASFSGFKKKGNFRGNMRRRLDHDD